MINRAVRTSRPLALFVAIVAGSQAAAGSAFAQPANATLRVTVVDQTGAVIVGATVTVTSAEPASTRPGIPPVKTTDSGVATIAALLPGRYNVQAEFPGFEKQIIADLRVRSGENKSLAVLPIERIQADVSVEQDKQQAAADRNGRSFGTTLTRDQIEALSDDPQVLQQQLQDMAGPGAVIRIDGFEGGALPAKAMIRSIRIARDQFAAEFHSAGGVSIEIITQPGIGPVRYFSVFQMRDGDLSGRSPFVPVKGPEGNVNYGFGMNGALVKDKSSFNLNVFGTNAYDTPNLNAAVPTGTVSRALSLRTQRRNAFVNGQLDYAVTLDQTLRFGYNMTRAAGDNVGVGGYDEPERAYATDNVVNALRAQHFGPVGRRAFSRSRIQFFWSDSDARSAIEAPTVRVLDAFTSGGAQRAGGDHSRTLNLASDLDYVRGRHSFRTGFVVDGTWYRSSATANYLGTYTFDNLDAYVAGQPSNYSRRVGDPQIVYTNGQGSIYLQDDIRVRKNLTLTPGVRYELQTHVQDVANLGPRFGATWAPFASGQTTLRASAGIFYDWLSTGTYDQTIRVDGFHQQELNVVNPAFPDPGTGGVIPPTNRYVLGDGYNAPRITRVSAGVDQGLSKVTRVSATYSYLRGSRLARGVNLNAPVAGLRPDPAFATIVEVVSDASLRQHQLQLDASVNPGALLPLPASAPRVRWKRITVFANYSLLSARNNTDGAFSVAPTGDLDAEWGPAVGGGGGGGFNFVPGVFVIGGGANATDIRSRLNLAINNQVIRNVMLALNVNTSTAPPYTLLTGRDNNADGIFNDRPDGAGRNTLRGSGQTTVNLMVGYMLAFGHTAALPPGIGVFGTGAAAQVRTIDQGTARYRVQLFIQAQNVTNEKNYVGYSGTMTSPFFAKPTAVSGMRKIDAGINFSF
jgi:carboxypeptidase family protein